MNDLSVKSMTRLLTLPYRRGSETLDIPLGMDIGDWTYVEPYDFKEYEARHQEGSPEPKYVLFLKRDNGPNTLNVEIDYFIKGMQTELSGFINAVTPTISVVSTAVFPSSPPFKIRIDDEIMNVIFTAGTTWTVTRGEEGTTAVPHANAVSVIHIQTTSIEIPSFTFNITSFAIPLPGGVGASMQIFRFRQLPIALPGMGSDNWGVTALLGNISKLIWVIGWEKDQIHQHLENTQRQRLLQFAFGPSLDLLGKDLRVPRFPPREYSYDVDTIALYHLNNDVKTVLSDDINTVTTSILVESDIDFPIILPFKIIVDDEVMNVTFTAGTTLTVTRGIEGTAGASHAKGTLVDYWEVDDETRRFISSAGHPGTNRGAEIDVPGKFNNAYQFPGSSGPGYIEIPTHSDFDVASVDNFTVEAFVKADDINDPSPRIVIMKGQQNAAGTLITPGWSLSVATYRGIPNNVRWVVRGSTNQYKIFADLNIADGNFHHIAGIIDRSVQRSLLFVDGEELSNINISALGAITNTIDIRIGNSTLGNAFFGTIDEVRLSSAARTEFYPVLGESDDAYRQRLGIFERWLLPAPDELLKTINSLVQIEGETDSFVLIEHDRPGANTSKVVRILPASLLAGQSIDHDGNLLQRETEVSGRPEDDVNFNEIYLLRHNHSQVNYGPDENNRRMQVATKHMLENLLDLLVSLSISGNLIIDKSFDPEDTGLHGVGRALLLRHDTLALQDLGIYAHQAGFSFVRNEGARLYVSVKEDEMLDIVIEPRAPIMTPRDGIDVFINSSIDLHIIPESLPHGGQIKWTLIPCGAGRAHFESHPSDAPDLPTPLPSRPHLRLVADAPGELSVRVEYTYQRRTVTGTRIIRISIESLGNNATISQNGKMKIDEADAVDIHEDDMDEIYLINYDSSSIFGVNPDYGANPNNRRMQIVLEKSLNILLQIINSLAQITDLQILKAYDPTDTGLYKVGRALLLRHNTISPAVLGPLAHQAGFGFVRRQGNEIYCSVASGEKIEISRASDLAPLDNELAVGAPIDLIVRSTTLPAGGNYNWSIDTIGHGKGGLDYVLRPQVEFTPRGPGLLLLNVTYLEEDPDRTFPYTFEIRLKASLDVPETKIPKHQYDLIMNILNYFHPVGVEVITQNIREHVVEVRENLLNAFPGYTYPDFRF
ncbi:MAG: LamG domain-containing protein [Planctomycetes bacterium]|nr:LamG domain-containing protein [Planctomycetota bacterium]